MAGLRRLLTTTLAVLLWSGAARAQSSLDLAWHAPAGCPDQASVVAAVQGLVTTVPPEALHVTATVHEEGERWTVALVLSGAASGTRTLRAKSCPAVARATALIVALALDPTAKLPPEDAPAEPPPVPAPPPPPPPPSAVPPPPARRASPFRPFVFVGATGERALLPGLALGAAFGVGVAWRAFRGDLAGQLAPSRNASLAEHAGAGGDLSLLALAARACAGPTTRWAAVAGCLRVRGARVAAEGANLAPSYRQSAYALAFEPGALVRIPGRTRLALELDASAVVPFTRPDFVVITNGANDPLFRAAAVGVRVGAGATFRF